MDHEIAKALRGKKIMGDENGEIRRALLESTIMYADAPEHLEDAGPLAAITDEWELAHAVTLMDKLIKDILNSTEDLFYIRMSLKYKVPCAFATPLGKRFLQRVRDIGRIQAHFPMYSFNPYFNLMDLYAGGLPRWVLPEDGDLTGYVGLFNDRVKRIRESGKGMEFTSWLNRHDRSARKNLASLLEYLRRMFDSYSKLLVLRIDFAYRELYTVPNTEDCITYAEIKQHRERLLRDLRTKLPVHCIGYVWRLEYAVKKGFHLHLMILLDGQRVREDGSYARMIGDHWNDIITEKKGSFWSCNGNKGQYKSVGIGMIRHDDVNKREAMESAATYLVKIDTYMEFVAPGNDRKFGKGTLPKQDGVRRGRPRKAGDNLVEPEQSNDAKGEKLGGTDSATT
jgi:hypothetical protein